MIRVALLPLIVLLSGFAPLYQFREPRWRNWAGWRDPAMGLHWDRLYRERTAHAARNILAEWCRLDPQRAGKAFSFALIVLTVLLIVK